MNNKNYVEIFLIWAPVPNRDYLPNRPMGCCPSAQRPISGMPLRGLPLVASSGRPLWTLAWVAFAYGRGPFFKEFRQKVFNQSMNLFAFIPLSITEFPEASRRSKFGARNSSFGLEALFAMDLRNLLRCPLVVNTPFLACFFVGLYV